MKLGLILDDREEEHDCFSDNTHNSHYYDELGIIAIYTGRYEQADGHVLVVRRWPIWRVRPIPGRQTTSRRRAMRRGGAEDIKDTADSGAMAYDMMLAEGNAKGNKLVQDGVDRPSSLKPMR